MGRDPGHVSPASLCLGHRTARRAEARPPGPGCHWYTGSPNPLQPQTWSRPLARAAQVTDCTCRSAGPALGPCRSSPGTSSRWPCSRWSGRVHRAPAGPGGCSWPGSRRSGCQPAPPDLRGTAQRGTAARCAGRAPGAHPCPSPRNLVTGGAPPRGAPLYPEGVVSVEAPGEDVKPGLPGPKPMFFAPGHSDDRNADGVEP